jgi:hypothetical protein
MSARNLTAFLFLIMAGLPAAGPRGSVKVIVPPGPLHIKKPVAVTVRNETTRTVWYCVEVSKTTLHDPTAETGTPVPVFRIKSRKTANEKWGDVAWGRDYGGLAVPEELRAGQERQYKIVLSEGGSYQIELAFKEKQMSAAECGQELKRAKWSRSRVFHVLDTNRSGGVPTMDPKDGSVHLRISVVIATNPKQ